MAASTEEIVTRFTADLTDLEQGIAKAGASLKKYEDYAGGAAASGNQLNSNLGSLTAKTMALEGVQKRVVAGTKEEAAALGTVATSMRVVSNEQSKLGNTKGFDAAGKAADEEAQKIAALIERITQLKAAHASAGTIEAKGPIAADIGTAQAELSAIPIPRGAQNTAEIASALAPLQAVQQQAVVAAAEVDKATKAINADLSSLGKDAPEVFRDLEGEVGRVSDSVGDLSRAEQRVVTNAGEILSEYRDIRNTGEKFPGQLDALNKRATETVAKVKTIAAEEERAELAARGLTVEFSRLPGILDKAATSAKGQAAATLQSAKATGQNVQQTGILGRAVNALKGGFTSIKQGVSEFGASVKSSFTSAIDQFKKGGGALDVLKSGLSQATSSVGGLSSGLTSMLGPLGIAVGAVGAFVANFSRLDSVKVVLDGLSIQLGIIGDRLANFDFSGLTFSGAARDAAAAQSIAAGIDAVEEAQLKVNKANADAEVQLAGLNNKLRDRTKSEEERLRIADQITKIEEERVASEIKLIKEKIGIQTASNAVQLISLGEVSDANKAALNELEVQQANAEARSLTLTETVERRRNSIIEEGINARSAANQKALEAARKAEEAALRAAEQRAEAEKNVSGIVKGLQDEELRTGLSAREQQAFDIDKKYDDLVTKATDSFAKLRKLAGEGTPGADTAAIASINAKQKEVNAQINAARDREQTAATQKATADEIKVRQDGQNQVLGVIDQGNRRELDAIRSKLSSGIALTGTEQANFLDLIARVNEAEIKAAQDKYAKLLEDNKKYNSDALGLTEQGKANEADLIAQKNAEINAANAQAEADRNAQTYALLQERIGILSASAEQGIALLAQAGAEGQLNSEQFAKQLIGLFLDTVEKIVLMNAVSASTGAIAANAPLGPGGVAKGVVEAALVTALIKGLFAAVKATIQGAYTGEDYIGGTPTWSGRDGHLRRVHTGERIVTAKTNAEHFDLFQAAEGGVLHDYLSANYVLPAINNYLESDDGRRVSTSIMVPKYHDANVVRGLKTAADKTDRTNELLYALLKKEPRVVTQSRRSWN